MRKKTLGTDSMNQQQCWPSGTRRRRGSGGGQLRASEPPIVRFMTPCLGSCALTFASTRGVHTHIVTESLNTLYTAEARTAQRLFAAAADRPNSSSSTQQRRRRGSGGGRLRASEPPIVHLIPCLGGCAFFGSVTCALLLGCVVSAPCFFLLLEKNVRRQKKSDIVFFARGIP